MAYERVNWENLPSTKTPVNADNLNKMDEGIANIDVGGRNLLTESSLLSAPSENANWIKGQMNNVTSNSFTNEGLKVITPQNVNPNSGPVIVINNANNLIKAGKVLTFSIDIKGKASIGHIHGFFRGNGENFWDNYVNIVSATDTTSEDWHRYSGSFTMPDTGTKDLNFYIDLGQGSASDEVTTRIYKNAKLERGNIATDWTPAPEDIYINIYPVGSIYMSVNNTNPANLFGGTWEQIKDRFLLSAGSSYANGSTGGSATHSHSLSRKAGANFRKFGTKFIQGESTLAGAIQPESRVNKYWLTDGSEDYSSDTIEGQAGVSLYGNTDVTTNLPPYLVVYVWKRTA